MSLVLEGKVVRIVENNMFMGLEGTLKEFDVENDVVEVEITRADGTVFTYRGRTKDVEEI